MKECTGTGRDWDWCRVEKMGCPGCHHYKNIKGKEDKNEQKVSECAKSKSD